MTGFIRRVLLALVTGYILFFFSELVFWSFWQPQNSFSGYIITWFVYSIIAYIFLLIVNEFKVRKPHAVFLAGAVFGWLVEGMFVMTFFGIDGLPLVVTVSWTGLAWHALISVLIGWYYTQRFLAERKVFNLLLFTAGLGFFWGFWANTWTLESPPIFTSLQQFALFAFVATCLYILCHIAYSYLASFSYQPMKIEKIIFAFAVIIFFVFKVLPAQAILAPAVLLPLFAIIFFSLNKNKFHEIEAGVIITASRVRFSRYFILLVIPLVATITYKFFYNLAPVVFPNFIILGISSSLGYVLLFYSVFRMFYPK